jgi:peptidoglycan L-alanyl-D-glutamate endopeptidase CwlK
MTQSTLMTLQEALSGKEMPPEIREMQTLVEVGFWGFDAQWQRGAIVVHRELAEETAAIFAEIAAARFPIEKVVPVSRYDWSDDLSMEDNNSSGFNYRLAVGKTDLSQHAWGRAIDINPRQNPYLRDELVLPPGAVYNPSVPGTLLENGPVVLAFEKRGWTWGGRWTTRKDWHHFEKPL